MKKVVFLLIAIFSLHGVCYSQTKNAAKPIATVATKPESEIVKENAEKWFKEVYVDKYFKDPYSYRLMGLKAIPISTKEYLLKEIAIMQNDIDTCTVSEGERNKKTHDECMDEYENSKLKIQEEQDFIDKGIDVEYHTKKQAIYKKFGVQYLELAKRIAIYLLAVEEKEKTEALINNLTEEQANQLAYYDIRLDCYSKNSLGNEVLGRFSFPFTVKGALGNNNGIDKVIQLNK